MPHDRVPVESAKQWYELAVTNRCCTPWVWVSQKLERADGTRWRPDSIYNAVRAADKEKDRT